MSHNKKIQTMSNNSSNYKHSIYNDSMHKETYFLYNSSVS
jgi:hypothetical protein